MLNVENAKIVETLVNDINFDFDSLMVDCVALPDKELIPGTDAIKQNVIVAKQEFDNRVTAWLSKVNEGCSYKAACDVPDIDRCSAPFGRALSDACSTTSSVASLKKKEGQVKLRLAMFAKQLDEERFQQSEMDRQKVERAMREVELAQQSVSDLQRTIDQENKKRQRDVEIRMAALEVKAWEELSESENPGFSAADRPDRGSERVKSNKFSQRQKWGLNEDQRFESAQVKSSFCENPLIPAGVYKERLEKEHVISDPSKRRLQYEGKIEVGAAPSVRVQIDFRPKESEVKVSSKLCNQYPWVREGYAEPKVLNVKHVARFPLDQEVVYGNEIERRKVESLDDRRYGAPQRGAYASLPVVHDYPLPRPEIPIFDGDPLSYWTFIRSFETHIAQRMPTDAARLVYLLQHCSPRVRKNLEHFSQNLDAGYRLAYESLFNDYGQPHIVAYSCEKRLLGYPVLKSRDPDGLKAFSVLMEKSLILLQDLGDFASLNSLGTIQRLTEKLSAETRKGWIKWAFEFLKQNGYQAKFAELVQFVKNEAQEVNSLYGKAFYAKGKERDSLALTNKKAGVFSASVTPEKTLLEQCPYCKGDHKLAHCKDFQQLARYERLAFLRKSHRCFRCLDYGHRIRDCKSTQGCMIEGCNDTRHHTLLHRHEVEQTESSCCAAVEGLAAVKDKRPYLMTVPVRVKSGSKEVLTYALLDSGSERSFCVRDLARKVGARRPRCRLPIKTLLSGASVDEVDGELISIIVSGMSDDRSLELRDVVTVKDIPAEGSSPPSFDILSNLEHLRGIRFEDLPSKKVGRLIGMDAAFVFRPLESRFGPTGFPNAMKTLLGWVLFGPKVESSLTSGFERLGYPCLHSLLVAEEELNLPPHKLVQPSELDVPSSREDRKAYELMKDSVQLIGGHFQLPLLWRSEDVKLPNNRVQAERRLNSLKRRLNKDKGLHQKYVKTMQKYIDCGHAEG